MTALFHAHSGIRYLVLAAGLLALLYFLIGRLRGKPFASPGPAILATFTGLVDLQVALAILLYASGGRPPGIVGYLYLGLMLLALATLHTTWIVRKRRPQLTGYGLPLSGVVFAAWFIGMAVWSTGLVWLGNTELIVKITADHTGVSAVRVTIRNIHYEEDNITKNIDPAERDVQWDPLIFQILPSHIAPWNEPFLVRAEGYVGTSGNLLFSAQSAIFEFEPGQLIEKTLMLKTELHSYDSDKDGFYWCQGLLPPYPDLCDCNDNDRFQNPLSVENCTNSKDDNCDGQVNEGCP